MDLTPDIVSRLLSYNPTSGALFWKERSPLDFAEGLRGREAKCAAWNARFSGERAFTILNSGGYLTGSIYGKKYLASRIIWFMVYGFWPNEVDHIDRDRTNNSLSNLRNADRRVNLLNRGDSARLSKSTETSVLPLTEDGWLK